MCNSKNFYSGKVINGHVPFAIYIIRRRKTIALQKIPTNILSEFTCQFRIYKSL